MLLLTLHHKSGHFPSARLLFIKNMERETKKRAGCNTNEVNRKPNEGEKSPERQEIYILVHFFAHFVPFYSQKELTLRRKGAQNALFTVKTIYIRTTVNQLKLNEDERSQGCNRSLANSNRSGFLQRTHRHERTLCLEGRDSLQLSVQARAVQQFCGFAAHPTNPVE